MTDRTDMIARIAISDSLRYIGEDPEREGLRETPARVIKSWETLYGGYKETPEEVIKTFDTPGTQHGMVVLRDIEFYSTCEHHMLPFFGKAHIGYLPGRVVLGVSKLARLLEVYTRRLQIQERIGEEVVSALMVHLPDCKGAGCVLEAQHMCMTARGVQKQHSVMVTSCLAGVFKTENKTRTEFLSVAGVR